MVAYADIVPIGTALIIGATSFGLGAVYGNWPYDMKTLFNLDPTGEIFERSLNHYLQWANAPAYVHYTLHGVMVLGLIGCLIKIYKCDPDALYFEYGTLGLFVLAIIIYLTNLRTGLYSCIYGNWGEVDMPTGINVMAASQVMIILVLFGILFLQAGLYYANWFDAKLKREFLQQEAEWEKKRAETVATPAKTAASKTKVTPVKTTTEPVAKTTGSSKPATKQTAKKTTKKKA